MYLYFILFNGDLIIFITLFRYFMLNGFTLLRIIYGENQTIISFYQMVIL